MSHVKFDHYRPTKTLPVPHSNTRSARNVYWPIIFMFAYGFGWAVTLEFQFRIYAAELFVLAVVPFFDWKKIFIRYEAVVPILSCLCVWFYAILLSDLYNQSHLNGTIRALATPLLAAASLVFVLACINQAPSSLLAFLVGTALGKMIFGEPFYGSEWAERGIDFGALNELNYFKARIEPFLTPLLMVTLAWIGRNNSRLIIIPAFILGLIYILLDARSVGFFFIIASAIFIMIHRKRVLNFTAFSIISLLAIIILYALYVVYIGYTLRENMASQTGMQLSLAKNPYNPFELLQIGRSEWAAMPSAIAERPFVGWGSWALDTGNRFQLMRLERAGSLNLGAEQFNGVLYIPAHSVIGAAWMWNGLLGMLAITSLFILLTRLGVRTTQLGNAIPSKRTAYLFITLVFSINMGWSFIFSPPQSVRTQFPIAIALLIYFSNNSIKNKIDLNSKKEPKV